jgi:hypothetical protein
MDPYVRIAVTIGASTFLASLIRGGWERFKAQKALEPIPLVMRGGVYRPWGMVHKLQHYGGIFGLLYLAQILILFGLLVYTWTVGPLV